MEPGFSQVFLLGVVSTKPRVHLKNSGLHITEFLLGGQEEIGGRTLIWTHRVFLVGSRAVEFANTLEKGQIVFVQGRLEIWTELKGEGEFPLGPDTPKQSFEVVQVTDLHRLKGADMEILTNDRGWSRLRHSLNHVVLLGELARDAQLERTSEGHFVTPLMVTNLIRGRPHYLMVRAWDHLAEPASKYRRGDVLLITGRLVNKTWFNKSGKGYRRSWVHATRIEQFLPDRPPEGIQHQEERTP